MRKLKRILSLVLTMCIFIGMGSDIKAQAQTIEEVAKLENLEASDDDIEKYYDDMAKGYGMDVAEVKKYVPKENIIDDVKLQKAVDFLKK